MKRLEARYNPVLIINKFRTDTAFNSIVCRLSKMKLKIPNSIIFLFRLEGGPEVSVSGMRKTLKIAADSSCTSDSSSLASGDENSSKLFKYWKTKSTSNEYPIRLFPQIEPGWTSALSKIIAEEKKRLFEIVLRPCVVEITDELILICCQKSSAKITLSLSASFLGPLFG